MKQHLASRSLVLCTTLFLWHCAGPATEDAGSDARRDAVTTADASDVAASDASDAGNVSDTVDATGASDIVDATAATDAADVTIADSTSSDAADTGGGCLDADGDGYGIGATCAMLDCDDSRADVHPGATETCNSVDDDCNALVDDGVGANWYADTDGDGFGNAATAHRACEMPSGEVADATDCDDTNAAIHPGATEACNGVDDNCGGDVDEGLALATCGSGACVRTGTTCMPSSCTPGTPSTETCNAIDDDCNGMVDDGLGTLSCGTGACARTAPACVGGVPGACAPGVGMPEVCNGLDDDCNGMTDEGFAPISCGVGACARTWPACVAGMPQTCMPGGPVPEVCNGIDDDCNGIVDDGLGTLSCGTGACMRSYPACVGGTPQTSCAPGSPTSETCNNIDDNCDGTIDEGVTQSCYTGPAGTNGVGVCRAGSQSCTSGTFGMCVGEVLPASETCANGTDDNCNGTIDEGCITNDVCTSATGYTIGAVVNGTTAMASNDYVSSCGNASPGRDVAYSVMFDGSPRSYTITSNTTGFDGVLHVHRASTCALGDEVACNDDNGSTSQSAVTLVNPPAGTYYIVQDGYQSGSGGAFTLSSTSTPLNADTCATPLPISANGTYTGTTVGAANNYAPPVGCVTASGGSAAPDVVYAITARASGTITASLCGSSFDTVMYLSTTCGSGTTACNDDATCGTGSSLSWSAIAGTTYYIVVDGYSTRSGNYSLAISGY